MPRLRLLLATMVILVASSASPSMAGTYVVYGCWSADTGGWSRLSGTAPGINSWAACPADQADPDGNIRGLRDVTTVGSWPSGGSSGWVFSAPANTEIVSVAGETMGPGGQETHPNSWSRGIWDPDTGAWLATAPIQNTGGWKAIATPTIAVRRVAVGLRCRANPCLAPVPGDQPKWIAWSSFRRLGVTIRDTASPAISIDRAPPTAWLNKERPTVSFSASDNVGVLWLEAQLDGRRIGYLPRNCFAAEANTAVAPCASTPSPLSVSFDAALLAEGTHTLVVSAGDVAGSTRAESLAVRIDHTAPVAPRARMPVASGWRRENRFDVAWTNPPETSGAPLASAKYWLCPAASRPYEEVGCTAGERSGSELSGIEGFSVPGDGAWTLRASLVDSAGNHDPSRDTLFEGLWLDTGPPQATFEVFDPKDPTRINVTARDELSGISRVEIEATRQGEPIWRALDVARDGERFSATIDDGALSDGSYDLRARAYDTAGNERSVTSLPDGSPMQLRLPVRALSILTVGQSQRVRVKGSRGGRNEYKTVIVRRPRLAFGETVTLGGRLTDDAGNPRDGADVLVTERVHLPGMEWRVLTTIKTDAKGRFALLAHAGPARSLRFAYAGTATARPGAQDVELRVRAAATLTPNRRRLGNGETVVFRGRLRGGPVPVGGKLIVLQARTRRGWVTFATPRTTASGRWTHPYTFTSTTTTVRYSFRALIPEEPSYPYAASTSPVARVVVLGAGGQG